MHLVYTVLLVGGAVTVYLIGKNSSGGSAHTRLGIAGAAVLLVLAYVLIRHVHPPRVRGVSLRVSPEEVRAGEELTVVVDMTRDTPVEVGLVGTKIYEHKTTDAKGRPWVVERSYPTHEQWQEADRSTTLRFELPLHAQPSELTKRPKARTVWTVIARRRRRLMYDRQTVELVTVKR
jgi:hypothetical protein